MHEREYVTLLIFVWYFHGGNLHHLSFFEPVLHLQLLVILLHLQLIVQCLYDMVRHHDVVTIHHKLVHIRNVNLAIKFVQIMQNPCCQVVVFVKKTTTCTGASAAASLEAGFSEDAAGMKRATARTHGLDGVGHHLDGVRHHLDGVRQHVDGVRQHLWRHIRDWCDLRVQRLLHAAGLHAACDLHVAGIHGVGLHGTSKQ